MEQSVNHKIFESFIRAAIGLAVAAIPAINTQNIPIAIGILGIAGFLSEVYLPRIVNRIPGNNLRNMLAILVLFLLLSGLSFEWYMRHDFFNYQNDKTLTVTHVDSKMKIKLRKTWAEDTDNGSLFVGEKVQYLGEKSLRKEIRLPNRKDGKKLFGVQLPRIHFLNAFYRKVKTRDGRIGWVYGSYLK